ncbi:hypothetical protein KP806_19955 [Paenibacillus sp. N4]|uniref:hypothetical protein n=1 Tax=Paenibacillus vietnamensis TaxID=2590547 RepID=UPI001CD06C86|nr:hypothetical protein [Paenibacillus vietnamensis]MCA0757336.1 hypothetical protein [Paenibacillus vietnamensis]
MLRAALLQFLQQICANMAELGCVRMILLQKCILVHGRVLHVRFLLQFLQRSVNSGAGAGLADETRNMHLIAVHTRKDDEHERGKSRLWLFADA